ncbi:MAG TPA: PadR family transcriptional regulator [Acidimicrobiales bacterium]
MGSSKSLSLNEWAVLGLVAEGETHGFAVSRGFAAAGLIGRIWTIPRPLVYRAIATLVARGLVVETGTAPGAGAPTRRLVSITSAGRAAVGEWLETPVAHVRDARSELLLKLLLLDRAGIDAKPLMRAQSVLVEPMLASLRGQLERNDGFESTIVRWRIYTTEALARFLDDLLSAMSSQPR